MGVQKNKTRKHKRQMRRQSGGLWGLNLFGTSKVSPEDGGNPDESTTVSTGQQSIIERIGQYFRVVDTDGAPPEHDVPSKPPSFKNSANSDETQSANSYDTSSTNSSEKESKGGGKRRRKSKRKHHKSKRKHRKSKHKNT